MNAYSEDLRKKIVEAKERGMPTVEVARTFGVGLSSAKRYAKVAREGGSLSPKRSLGRRPRADERARRLLEADLRERPAATLSERREYLRSVAGLGVSESTVSRLLRRMGWTRKKFTEMPKGRLPGTAQGRTPSTHKYCSPFTRREVGCAADGSSYGRASVGFRRREG